MTTSRVPTNDIPDLTKEQLDRFWIKVNIPGETQCWEWLASRKTSGYGTIAFNGRTYSSHRVAWTIAYGAIPDDLCVLHACDNRGCCNPTHLFLGTYLDNRNDCQAKGRVKSATGERSSTAKLTADQVLHIRKALDEGANRTDLARQYGVAPSNISQIRYRKTWKHLTTP